MYVCLKVDIYVTLQCHLWVSHDPLGCILLSFKRVHLSPLVQGSCMSLGSEENSGENSPELPEFKGTLEFR